MKKCHRVLLVDPKKVKNIHIPKLAVAKARKHSSHLLTRKHPIPKDLKSHYGVFSC